MSFDLDTVVARSEIRDVLERYCRGIDRLDADLVNGVYWDEAIDDHGIYKGPGKDFAAFVLPMLRQHFHGTMHSLHQSLIELKVSRAHAETYFVAYHWGTNETGRFIDIAGGRYVDVLERRNGEWRILDRTVVIEWTRLEKNLETSALPLDGFMPARRDRTDIAYGRR